MIHRKQQRIKERMELSYISLSASIGQFDRQYLQVNHPIYSDLPCCAVARVIEQCCFNSTPDLFNGQTTNFILKPPKLIESRTYVKKTILEGY